MIVYLMGITITIMIISLAALCFEPENKSFSNLFTASWIATAILGLMLMVGSIINAS